MSPEETMPQEVTDKRIFLIRGQKVMSDKDLVELYQIEAFNLDKAVNRNIDRFPADFVFQFTDDEFKNMIFHFGISKWGGAP